MPAQTAITRDNVTLSIDGVLYVKVVDAYKAAYGVEDPHFAITQLAQTTMRSEIGKISRVQHGENAAPPSAPPQGVPSGSGWLVSPKGSSRAPLGAQPLPGVDKLAASKLVSSTACEPPALESPGSTTLSRSARLST